MERKTNKRVMDKIGSVFTRKSFGGEEDEVLWPHRPKKQHGKKTETVEDGRQAADLQRAPGYEKNGQSWTWQMHRNWQPIGKDGAKSLQSQQRRQYHLTRGLILYHTAGCSGLLALSVS